MPAGMCTTHSEVINADLPAFIKGLVANESGRSLLKLKLRSFILSRASLSVSIRDF